MRQKVSSEEIILEAAMEIAMKEGLHSLSVRKLAKACNMAVGSMYNYYSDKDALIHAVASSFWDKILEDQEKLYRPGMRFTTFLEQYYNFLWIRLAKYDNSWLEEMNSKSSKAAAVRILRNVLQEDRGVNHAIWNMELTEHAFCEYVFVNIMALLRAGEESCGLFLLLVDHLLYE